jgi:hypothetical protein
MKVSSGRVLLSLCVVSASFLVTACGSDTAPNKSTQAEQPSTVGTPGNCQNTGIFPASPTVAQLDALLKKGLDPTVPATDKADLVQGISGDLQLFDRLGDSLREAKFSTTIKGVTDYCDGTANADAALTFGDQTTDAQVPLVADENVWKLELEWTCGLAKNLNQSSPLCP